MLLIELLIIIEVNGYDDKWIKSRLTGIVDRFKLTDVWKENGISKNYEYGILTNEIYQEWSGMKASQYKEYKGLRKESLRENMTALNYKYLENNKLDKQNKLNSSNKKRIRENNNTEKQ